MASSPVRIGDLEINQDLDAQHKTWVLQRIGWAGMALIILAALAGLFGSGPLARKATVDDRQLFRLEYDRFGRYESELFLQLELTPEATKSDRVTVWVDRTYWTNHVIKQIAPEPIASSTAFDGFLYTFEVGTQHVQATIIFRLRPEYLGWLDGHIRVNDKGSVTFRQFMFP